MNLIKIRELEKKYNCHIYLSIQSEYSSNEFMVDVCIRTRDVSFAYRLNEEFELISFPQQSFDADNFFGDNKITYERFNRELRGCL